MQGSKPLVVGANGPLSAEEASALYSKSASLAFTPSLPSPPPTTSLASVLLPTLSTPELAALARTTEIGAGVKLEDLSAKFWGFGKGFGGTDGFPVNGYQTVLQSLVGGLEQAGGKVELEKEVVGVEDLGVGRGVKLTTRSGETYTARTVISTIPLAVLQRSPPTFSPPLPASLLATIERTRVGVLEKVVLAYDAAWWPEPDTYGQYLLLPTVTTPTANPSTLADLFAQTTLNVSSFARIAQTPHPTLLIYLGADAGSYISRHTSEEVIDALHLYLTQRLSTPSAPAPSAQKSVVTTWLSDPFSFGATSSPVTLATSADGEQASPLDFITLGRSLWDGRLGFAGEHTDLDNRGSATGAVISGKREGERVKELLERLA